MTARKCSAKYCPRRVWTVHAMCAVCREAEAHKRRARRVGRTDGNVRLDAGDEPQPVAQSLAR